MYIVRRRRGTCPTGKRWYGSELEAKITLSRMADARDERRAYKCDKCNGWHLTSQARTGI